MPTLKRKRRQLNNKVYSSVKLLSTTNTIDKAINELQKSVTALSSSDKKFDPKTKSIVRTIKHEINNIICCNTVIENEIAPSPTATSVSNYCHKRIVSSGPDRLSHVEDAILITPEKRSVPYRGKPNANGYKYVPTIPINSIFYTPVEAMQWLVLPVSKITISGKIAAMIRLKYVPIGRSRLYTMYKHFVLTGLCSKEWHLKERRPILTVTELN